MGEDRNARYGAFSGILFLILFVIGYGVFIAQDAPDISATADQWQSYYLDHQDRIQAGLVIVSVSVFFLLWFLGSLRAALGAAEGGNSRLTAVAYGGGLMVAAFFLIAITATATAAYRPDQTDPAVTQALNDLALLCGTPAAAAFTALFGASAIVGYRHGAFPAPIAGLSALAAVTSPLTFPVAVTQTGAFAADGALGLTVPLITFVVGFLALSVALVRKAPQ